MNNLLNNIGLYHDQAERTANLAQKEGDKKRRKALTDIAEHLYMLHDDLVVLGLHCVFEHHAAMTPIALEAFLHEYRIAFPVAVDRPAADGPIPRTMAAYGFQGTPSTIVIDRAGLVVRHSFGAEDDLVLGLVVGGLLTDGRGVGVQ